MVVASTLFFFACLWGMGFALTRLVKESENFFERNIMRLGFGLIAFPVLGVILDFIHVPLDWKVFLAISFVAPAYSIIRRRKFSFPSVSLTYSNVAVAGAIMIAFLSLWIYTSGAFSYPYLEDDDPWAHASGIKYVSVEKVAHASAYKSFIYLDPYPPGYDIVMGVIHQTNDSVYWTMKFFNALIISLGFLFFFFLAKALSGNSGKALFSTFVLASVPAFLSHFIWAHSLVVTLFFPTAYSLFMAKNDRRWLILCSLGFSSFLFVQPTQAVKLFIMLSIAILVICIAKRRILWSYLLAPVAGFLISLIWWASRFQPFFLRGRAEQLGEAVANASEGFFPKIVSSLYAFFHPASGTATRAYTFSDFFIAKSENMINNPIGIGIAVSILVLFGIIAVALHYRRILREKKAYLAIALLWLVFTFLGINSLTFNLPVGLFAFRFWMLFAIPVALLAAEGLWLFFILIRQLGIPKNMAFIASAAILMLAVIGVIFTAGVQKYDVNTAPWGAGAFWTYNSQFQSPELEAYVSLRTLPPDTKVFSLLTDDQVIGFDKFSCGWCEPESGFRERGINITAEELHGWLLENGYEYFIIGGMEVRRFGENQTYALLNGIQDSGLFSLSYQNEGALLFRT
ncbi:hypothetical protein JXB11_01925 [Candidatus Woesearchaeota archaeon]|nr:hypothetical protein [Candidatus Woesearchaeota archaeon]